ncbi:MAG: hypothetical protein B6D56_05090 [Candidatus Omnitrophica bacterium 4484_70.1]|nr:MAG: hypothetical protein B6D56_05090 [Candidatus Omnitrophica bacterium 4484_70.1]
MDVFLAEEQEFQRLLKNSQVKKDGNFLVRIASLKDIIRMKKSSARPIDLADLELIKEYKKYRKNYK